MKIKCDKCGYEKHIANPFGRLVIEFVMKDGRSLKMCETCIEHLGELTEEAKMDPEAKAELDRYFDELGGEDD